jgi:hypothetical protein
MFILWSCAFDETGKGAKLAVEAKNLDEHMYGNGHFGWQGALSHSQFTGQLGTESYGTVRQSCFDEQMVVLHDLYNGELPDDMIEQTWAQSAKGNVMQRQMRSARDDAASDVQKAKRLSDVAAIKANWTPVQKEERTEKGACISRHHDGADE